MESRVALPTPAVPPPRYTTRTRTPAPGKQLTDADLARALRTGDHAAAELAWHRFWPLVSRMVRRKFDCSADIEDVVQEVFICLLDRVRTLAEPQALCAFVMAVTRLTVMYQARRRHLRRWVPLHDGDVGAWSSDVALETPDTARLLGRLRSFDRNMLLLRHLFEFELTEIATITNLSLATVKRRLRHAQRRLNAVAGARGASEGPPRSPRQIVLR